MTQRLLEDFAGITSDWFWEMDENLRFSWFSSQFQEVTGAAPSDVIGRSVAEISPARLFDGDLRARLLEELAARRPFRDFVFRFERADGALRWLRSSGQPVYDESGRFRGYRAVVSDITEARETALELERQHRELLVKEATLEQVERMASIGAWDYDLATGGLRWTDEVHEIYGLPRDETPTVEIAYRGFPEKPRAEMQEKFRHIVKHGGRAEETAPFVTLNGRRKWVRWIAETGRADGRATRLFGTFQDVTEERERGDVIKRLAHTDVLTGLANRTVFQNVLRKLCRGEGGEAGRFVLFLIDIDHFKHVNDFYGHDAGDKVLRFAARKLDTIFGDRAVIARLGGDELAVIDPGKGTADDSAALAECIRDAFRQPVSFHGHSIELTVSVGIALGPEHGTCEQEILRAADLALYRSKRRGRDRATLYDASLTAELNQRSQLLADFKASAAQDRIVPYYQPVVDLASGRHLGFEALMRWQHPGRGLLTPAAFSCVFEDSRAAQIVTRTMLSAVAGDLAAWSESGLPVGKVAINLTSADLRDERFIDDFFAVLDRHGLTPHGFVVEVTENVIFGDREEAVVDRINALSNAGIEIALDDFGTGFASLTHLQMLPVDIVKIDKSFVLKPDLSAQDLAILKAVIELGNALGFSTVAEGIEEDHHCKLLRLMGCDRGQGYYFSSPLPGADVPPYLLGNFVVAELAVATRDADEAGVVHRRSG